MVPEADRFQLLALDVDGTLLRSDGQVSPHLATILKRAADDGVRICLCTGRPLAATLEHVNALDPGTPPVVFNGALVPSFDGRAVIYRRTLDPAVIQTLVNYGRQRQFHLELHTLEECVIERDGPIATFQRKKFHRELELHPFDEWVTAKQIFKAQYVIQGQAAKVAIYALAERLDGQAVFSWGVSPGFEGHFVNVNAPGVSKEAALDALLTHLGIAWERVLAAGDSPSDLGYVQRAGMGVIMGNAPAEVRRAAPYVADSVEEDGLAKVIEPYLFDKGSLS